MVLRFHLFEDTEFGKEFWQMFWVSLILHAGVIVLIAFSRNIIPQRMFYAPPSYTTVDLVTAAEPRPVKTPAKRKPAPAKPKAEKAVPIPETHKEKLKPVPVKKAEPVVEKKAAPVAPPAKEYSDKEITSRIANLKTRVDAKRAAEQQAIAARGRITSRVMEIKYKVYYNTIWEIIRGNWMIPEGISVHPDLETIIGIRIAKTGKVLNITIEKSSDTPPYDDSAIRAIEKSSPLPPLPGEEEEMEIGIRFTPEERP